MFFTGITLLILLLLPSPSRAMPATFQHERFEWGLGLLTFNADHYRGSDQSKNWLLPLPYFVYTGENIEAEPSFIRGTFFKNDSFSFKLSLNAGLSVESEKNNARRGMPSLDYTLEAGPMLLFKIWKSEDSKSLLNLEWPTRLVASTDLTYLKHQGLFSVPYLNLVHFPQSSTLNWGSEFSIAVMYGSSKFHQYFYGVDHEFATPERPFYKADNGYSGLQTTWILSRRIGDVIIMPFIRWDYLDGVSFEDSPLFKRKNYLLTGLGTFWLFGGDKPTNRPASL